MRVVRDSVWRLEKTDLRKRIVHGGSGIGGAPISPESAGGRMGGWGVVLAPAKHQGVGDHYALRSSRCFTPLAKPVHMLDAAVGRPARAGSGTVLSLLSKLPPEFDPSQMDVTAPIRSAASRKELADQVARVRREIEGRRGGAGG